MKNNQQNLPWHFLLLLVLAGESVFLLPFLLPRIFRPTVLETFALDNLQLGFCFSAYGIVALVSYLLGGPIADKYPPRKLIAVSLWMTALGGVVFSTYPDPTTLKLLYGYWGFTTIFLFWAPMIKAARVWGGTASQGRAFGFLDGGRGLVGALVGTLGTLVFGYFLGSDIGVANLAESRASFRYVILSTSVIAFIVGLLCWFFLKMDKQKEQEISTSRISVSQIKEVLTYPSVWLLMVIILCAYVGYKSTDIISQYAEEIMLYDQIQSANVGNFLQFIRPAVGIALGFLVDKSKITLWLMISFVTMIFGASLFASGMIIPGQTELLFFSIITIGTGVYAARALYFAVIEKGEIPLVLTGTAVGLVSIVGYTPDIFATPLMGYLLDNSPGIKGHQQVFWMLTVFSFIGGIAAWFFYRRYGVKKKASL